MIFLVQFVRFRRGVPEVVRTLRVEARDGPAALAHTKRLAATRSWPMRTEAIRVMDDGGRTLIDWNVPVPAARPTPSWHQAVRERINRGAPATLHSAPNELPGGNSVALTIGRHLFDVGQPVSYAEDGRPEIWAGGYEIIALGDPRASEPQYAIRSADQSYGRIVHEHELREDLGARVRGQ